MLFLFFPWENVKRWPKLSVELRQAIVKMVGWVKAKNLKLKAQSHSIKLKSGYTAAWVQGLTGSPPTACGDKIVVSGNTEKTNLF